MENTLIDKSAIAKLFHQLITESDCRVDRFDASYLDDLTQILTEIYDNHQHPKIQAVYQTADINNKTTLEDLPHVLKELGVTDDDLSPLSAYPEEKNTEYRHKEVTSWEDAKEKTINDKKSAVKLILRFQEEYSRKNEKKKFGIFSRNTEQKFHDLARPETGDIWTPMLQEFVQKGVVAQDAKVLTLGPRWAGEITYFREVIGLKKTIGLDLFSHNKKLVKVGDMHDMPFKDNTFGIVYQRNTFDKSYNIRKALLECVRVLKDGGYLISDECLDYTWGVCEAARTNIVSNAWIIRFLKDYVSEVTYDVETQTPTTEWISKVGQLVIKVKK